ncbi:hypothetical protein CALCODRAFT_520192 [Calocera cornea HHB12733]|uniref:Uncharacterized protein n=1 Tax=Calocera cornea HHB12733 TaxID=1353952 RepID=A0A165DPQ5_9BASI|nr:hypothetical protein CALCODRAFT_520192 [Calocera cornea HHB12733]
MDSSIFKKRKVNAKQNGKVSHADHEDPALLALERMSQLDAQAAALRAEQERIRGELLAVLRERNSLMPINRLPIELLSTIFEWTLSLQGCGSRYLDRSPLNISQVCSFWRSVTLETPDLWADIRVGFGAGPNAGFHSGTLSQLRERLKRSGSVPLHITYKHSGSQQGHECIEEVVDTLRKEAPRIRSLRTVDQVLTNNLFDSLPAHMPQLEFLSIAQANAHQIMNLVPYEQIPFRLAMHSLKTLTLQHIALQIIEDSTSLQDLRELYLYHSLIQPRAPAMVLPGPGDFTPQDVALSLNVLRLMPNLEVLSIKHVYVDDTESSEQSIPLHRLHKLALLIMEDPPEMGAFRVPMIFEHLEMPNLRDLELWGQPLEQVTPQGIFNTLATQNPKLHRLALRHAVIPAKPFLTLLTHLQDLRVLDCLNTTTLRPVLKALRKQDPATGKFPHCPNLEELHLRALQGHLQAQWVSRHLERTLRARHLSDGGLKKVTVYPVPQGLLRRLRAYTPYIVTDGGKRVTAELQDAIERSSGMEDPDHKFHFHSNRVFYDRANGIGVADDGDESDVGTWPDPPTSDSSDDEDMDLLSDNFGDMEDVMGVDALLNTSDMDEEEEEEVDWSTDGDAMTDGDGMTDGDFMTEVDVDGITEGDASFIGSDPVTDIDIMG